MALHDGRLGTNVPRSGGAPFLMATIRTPVATRRRPPGRSALRNLLYAALLAATSAGAQNMYKCSNAGKVEYSDKPCLNGDLVKQIAPDGSQTREDRARVHMRSSADQAALDATAAAKRANERSPRAVATGGSGSPERK